MSKLENVIMCGDSLNEIRKIPDDYVHLTFTSPPYNAEIKYNSYDDDMSFDDYIEWLKSIFAEIYRTTVSGGRCVINVDAIKRHKSDITKEYRSCMYAHIHNMMVSIGWLFRDEICWSKQNISGKKSSWGSWMSCSNPCTLRNHEYVIIFCKDGWKLEGDMEKSDMTREEFVSYTMSTWSIQPDSRGLANHPAIFPEELAKRVIKLYSYRDNIILDPFSGSGTVPYVAKLYGRKYIGIDIDPDYCKFSEERIENANMLFVDKYIPRSERVKKPKNNDKEDMDLF